MAADAHGKSSWDGSARVTFTSSISRPEREEAYPAQLPSSSGSAALLILMLSFLTIRGERHYLWRAVDQEGNILDILV
jgi:DDE domain